MNFSVILSIYFFFFSMLMFSLGLYFVLFNFIHFMKYNIMSINSCSIVMTILLDWKTFFFMSTVLFISSVIMFYMMFNRFILLMMTFVFSMIVLIISSNLISLLLGWDGLGLI